MAGKQMAIDSDLNTGAITDKRNLRERKKLQQENSFFGSMDGATKYVKGDATAGLIITGINLVGGIVMGMIYGGLSLMMLFLSILFLQSVTDCVHRFIAYINSKASSDGELGDEIVGQLFFRWTGYLLWLVLRFLSLEFLHRCHGTYLFR